MASAAPASVAPASAAPATLAPTPWLSPYATPAPLELGSGPDLPIGAFLMQLALVTVLFVGAGYALVKYMRDRLPGMGLIAQPGAHGLKVVDRVMIDQVRSAFIVSVGKRYFLLAASGEQITTVAELDRADVEPDFSQVLEKENRRDAN